MSEDIKKDVELSADQLKDVAGGLTGRIKEEFEDGLGNKGISGRIKEEFEDGLGNKLTGRIKEEFEDGLGNK